MGAIVDDDTKLLRRGGIYEKPIHTNKHLSIN